MRNYQSVRSLGIAPSPETKTEADGKAEAEAEPWCQLPSSPLPYTITVVPRVGIPRCRFRYRYWKIWSASGMAQGYGKRMMAQHWRRRRLGNLEKNRGMGR